MRGRTTDGFWPGRGAVERVLAGFLAGVALMVVAVGCGTTKKQTESLLLQSGFKAVPPTTAQQKEELEKLPSGKVSMVTQQQKALYVYPDRSHKLLYVGQEAQYELYLRILQDEKGFNKDKQAFQDERALKDAREGMLNGWDLEW